MMNKLEQRQDLERALKRLLFFAKLAPEGIALGEWGKWLITVSIRSGIIMDHKRLHIMHVGLEVEDILNILYPIASED